MDIEITPLARAVNMRAEAARDAAVLVAETFRLQAALMKAAETLARDCGLTAARWQVLDALRDRPATVAALARTLGLTRQSVRRTARRLEQDGHLSFAANPDHRRAELAELTDQGRAALTQLDQRQADWLARASRDLPAANIRIATGLLRGLRSRLG